MRLRRLLPTEYIPTELRANTWFHVVVILVTVILATVLFAWIEQVSLVDALYFIVLTITLIGANFGPATLAGKVLTIVVAVVSVGVILSFMTQVLGPAALAQYWEKLRARKVSRMKNHVVVCGFSDTARVLLQRLSKDEILVVVKEKDVSEYLASVGVPVIHGDYETIEVLRRAGVAESRAVVAASRSDAENAFVCLTSKRLAATVPVIATVSSQENLEKLGDAHADEIISPAVLSAEAVLKALTRAALAGTGIPP